MGWQRQRQVFWSLLYGFYYHVSVIILFFIIKKLNEFLGFLKLIKMESSGDLEPHLTSEKRWSLYRAVGENNVELLKDLLDSPKLYSTPDSEGCNLLQIAICYNSKEVFDYLLSLPDYPLDFENQRGITALEKVFIYDRFSGINCQEYFACELIKRGACIDRILDFDNFFHKGDTLLHHACLKGYVKASMLLIEKGIDVNACGYNNYTPLQKIFSWNFRKMSCVSFNVKYTEIILMLLEFGADTSVRDENGYTLFEDSVERGLPNEVQEALFYYTFDEFSLLQIHLDILLRLAANNSSLFYEIIKQQFEKIIVDTNVLTVEYFFNVLKYIDLTNLKILITKYETSFQIFFAQVFGDIFEVRIDRVFIEKLNILIESSSKDQIINNLVPLVLPNFFYKDFISYESSDSSESELTEYICFLLSYGMEVDEDCLHSIYERFGYCDLFKILLHMDIEKTYDSCILPNLLINVNKTLEYFLKYYEKRPRESSDQLKELMSYFVHPKLHSIYRQAVPEGSFNVPNVPSLLELSRNVFRSYFIEKFKIKSSRKFYTLLNCLKISPVHKRMITYETKLYSP